MSENAKDQAENIAWDVIDAEGKQVSQIELDASVFGAKIKPHLMHEVVVAQDAKRRRGTAATKTRADVRGGGTKPWRQKGTGRARAGSIRSPLWVGGGTVFGPHPRDYSYNVPKKIRRAALRSALSLRVKEEKLMVVESLEMDEIKTRRLAELLEGLEVGRVLVVIPEKEEKLELSSRNLSYIKVLRSEGLNVRDILRFEKLILTRQSVEKIQEALK